MSEEGRIFAYDLTQPDVPARELRFAWDGKFKRPKEFRPTGLTVLEREGKRPIVWAVDSYSGAVVKFTLDVEAGILSFVEATADPELGNPNDVVALNEKEFFVSNFIRSRNSVLVNLELSFRLPLGSVFFYDGKEFRQVLSGLRGPNGLAVSRDKKFLYLALNLEEELRIYEIHANRSLELRKSIPLYTGLDNVNVDATGAIWIGAHPILYQVVLHTHDPRLFRAPSQVLKVSLKEGLEAGVEEVYADDGKQLSASTAGFGFRDKLLIGTMFDRALLCQLK